MTLLQQPLFHVGQRYVTVLGLIAFVGFFAAGVIVARFLQSQIVIIGDRIEVAGILGSSSNPRTEYSDCD